MNLPPCSHGDERICKPGEAYDWKRHCSRCRRRLRHGACRHLGEERGLVLCPTCAGKVELKVFACAVHGECTALKRVDGVKGCCQGCQEYERPDPFGGRECVRNLIYFIYPVKNNGVWSRNVAQLLKRIRLFNGRRVVAIATDGRTDPAEWVKDQFAGHVHEFIEVRNNPGLGEVTAWGALMERVETTNPLTVTWYGHAKGVSRPVNEGVTVHRWTEMMYETCLDYWPLVYETLDSHALAGSMRLTWGGFTGSASVWHYSGAFFWLRNRDVFSQDWRKIDPIWGGVEAWPGIQFPQDRGAVLFHKLNGTPYDMGYMTTVLEPELAKWRQENASKRKAW